MTNKLPTEQETYEMLENQKKVLIRIKTENNNPNYVTERVFVNGVCIQIPVGKDVEVLNISNGMYDVIGDDPYTDLFLG